MSRSAGSFSPFISILRAMYGKSNSFLTSHIDQILPTILSLQVVQEKIEAHSKKNSHDIGTMVEAAVFLVFLSCGEHPLPDPLLDLAHFILTTLKMTYFLQR